jgi:hypothetical protein
MYQLRAAYTLSHPRVCVATTVESVKECRVEIRAHTGHMTHAFLGFPQSPQKCHLDHEYFQVLSRSTLAQHLTADATNLRLIKIKAIPLQAWTGPEGSRRLKLPDFKTIGT